MVLTDANAFFQSLGFRLSLGDQEEQAKAAATWLNKRGGIGGRRVTLDFYRTSTGQFLADNSSTLQAACTQFAEDSHVDAVVSYMNNTAGMEECVTKRGIFVARSNYGGRLSAAYRRYGTAMREPANLSAESTMVTVLDALGRQGYWKGHKVGWFLPDDPDHAATASSPQVKQALARNGISNIDMFRYSPIDVRQGSQDAAAAVVRFRSSGVDRVILTGLGSTTYFMNAASSQNYVPGYAISSDVAPSATPVVVSDDRQLQAVRGVGWQPANDVGYRQVTAQTQGMRDCVTAIRESGQETSDSALLNALFICDGLFFLDYGADRSTGRIDPGSLGTAVVGAPNGFSSAVTQRADLRYPDGASAYQTFRFDQAARVFRYVAPPARTFR